MEGTIEDWQMPTRLFQLPAVIKANTTIAIIAKAIATSRSGGLKWTPQSRQMSSEFKLRPSFQSQRSSAALV